MARPSLVPRAKAKTAFTKSHEEMVMLTDKEMLFLLEAIRDKAMESDCDYSEKQSKALQKVMDAIDILA